MDVCIYVRDLTPEEGRKLQRALRHSDNPITWRRAQILLLSAQGMRVPEIARSVFCSEETVRDVIHLFEAEGLECLKPRYRGGRPPKFTAEARSVIVEVALARPADLGLPFTQWSLRKMRDYLQDRRLVESISRSSLSRILREENVSYQRTKTWKGSNDPDYEVKKTGS
jgi:transposase